MKILSILVLLFAFTFAQAQSEKLQSLGNMNKYPTEKYSSCWGYTAPDGREYALLGVRSGTSIVDITEAPNLKEVSFVPNLSSPWTELKVYKSYAYVIKDGAAGGIQIIDLSKLPESATLVNTIPDLAENHMHWVDADNAHLYTVGGSNDGVTIWDLTDPVHPKAISTFNKSVYVHDIYIKGNRAYLFEILSKSFSIYDVSNVAAPKLIKRVRDAAAPSISFHNGWTTEDGRYLITTEETDGRPARIWDLKDETNPVVVSQYLGAGNMAHNVHINGNIAHFAHYGGGYRAVDISDITNPFEVAFFDKNTQSEPGFTGVWGIYPYFESGKVIMSDIEEGLFVVKFNK